MSKVMFSLSKKIVQDLAPLLGECGTAGIGSSYPSQMSELCVLLPLIFQWLLRRMKCRPPRRVLPERAAWKITLNKRENDALYNSHWGNMETRRLTRNDLRKLESPKNWDEISLLMFSQFPHLIHLNPLLPCFQSSAHLNSSTVLSRSPEFYSDLAPRRILLM